MPQRQLGELMTELGLISEEQLATVLEVQQRSKRPLGQIIVELGFASGAAVAHALAMQSGGALRTEYGFALGLHPEHGEAGADETPGGLPKLRLAPTAVVPPVRANLEPDEEPPTEQVDETAEVAEAAEVAEVEDTTVDTPFEVVPETDVLPDAEVDEVLPETEETPDAEVEEVLPETEETPDAEVEEVVPETEETPDAEVEEVVPETEESSDVEPEDVLDEPASSVDTPPGIEADAVELEQLHAEIERLEAALAEDQTVAMAERERLQAEVAKLEAALAEAIEREQELTRLREEHEHATTELERLQSTLSEAQTQREQELTSLQEQHKRATNELERLQTTLADAQTEREQELTGLQEQHEHRTNELEQLRTALAEAQALAAEHERRLTEEQERHAGEQSELAAQRDRLHAELGDAFERLAAAGTAAEERDQLRAEIERFEATFAETQATAAAERERLLDDVDRLKNALAAAQTAHEQELGRLRDEHHHNQAELDGLRTELTEAQASTTEQARRLAEEQEQHAGERSELTTQRDRLQEELGDALERLGVVGPAAEERDALRTEVEQLRAASAETQEACAADLRRMADERDNAVAELAEAQEMLLQAERVRESQIALTAERDRAVAELEQLRTIAEAAQAAVEERTRLLAEEQERRHQERESLLAQRTLLEQELGSAIEQLAVAGAAADEQERQLELRSQQLLEALDAARRLAAELMPAAEGLPDQEPQAAETEADRPEAELESVAPEPETEPLPTDTESGPVDYSLFVPSPNGYELVPQTGVPPQAGETVEIVLPDRTEPTVFEVVRSGRTLPGGDVCVYLAQV